MNYKLIRVAGIVLAMIFCVSAEADEVEKEIRDALDAYKKGEYSRAIGSLEFATQEIRELKAEKIGTLFPEPLPGWHARESESMARGNIFLGGLTSASREYMKATAYIKIAVTTDNPMISFVSGILSNPAMLSMASQFGANAKISKIKGYKAIKEWDSKRGEGSIKIVIRNKALVTIDGSDCRERDVMDYARALDFAKIEEFISD